jgi:hypothetical protein
MTYLFRGLRVAAFLVAAAAPLSAQTVGLRLPGRFGLGIEALRPNIAGSDAFGGAALFMSGHSRILSNVALQVEVPFAFADHNSQAGNLFGNPYAGLQLRMGWWTIDVGGRWPLVSQEKFEDATVVWGFGRIADEERFEAFFVDAAAISAVARLEQSNAGLAVAVFGGPLYLISAQDSSAVGSSDNNLLVIYGGEMSYSEAGIRAGARITGRLLATESDRTFSDRTLHQLAAFAGLGQGPIRPTLEFRYRLDDGLNVPNQPVVDSSEKWSGGLGLRIVLN